MIWLVLIPFGLLIAGLCVRSIWRANKTINRILAEELGDPE